MATISSSIKARMQAYADALDNTTQDPVTGAVRAPVGQDQIAGIIARYGFGSEPPAGVYPAGHPISFPGTGYAFDGKSPGAAYAPNTFLDFLLSALGDEVRAMFGLGQTWFEWNGTDLTQFDTKVVGPNVSGSSTSVMWHAGVQWISIEATSDGLGSSISDVGVALPISQTPPSANYVVLADFVTATQVSGIVGATVYARFVNLGTNYQMFVSDNLAGAGQQQLYKVSGGAHTQLGVGLSDPFNLNGVGNGLELGLSVFGESILKARAGEMQIVTDTSAPITGVGQAAIGTHANPSTVGSVLNYFRNIRCIEVLQ